MRPGRALLAVVPLAGLVACADIWGFDDLGLGGSGPSDATVDAPAGEAAPVADGSRADAGGEEEAAAAEGGEAEGGEAAGAEDAEGDAAGGEGEGGAGDGG